MGIPEFYNKAIELALGSDSQVLHEKRNATAQGISGTGSLRIGSAFLSKFWEGNREIYVPNPTWGNHIPIFEHAGMPVKKYRYYDPNTCGLDFKGCLDDISVSVHSFSILVVVQSFLLFWYCRKFLPSQLSCYTRALTIPLVWTPQKSNG